jgi:hypothetical protein
MNAIINIFHKNTSKITGNIIFSSGDSIRNKSQALDAKAIRTAIDYKKYSKFIFLSYKLVASTLAICGKGSSFHYAIA